MASTLLLPLSVLYGQLSAQHLRRQAKRAWRAPVPVIVIGNILVGGTGKTPLTQALCQFFQTRGWRPGLISRGYGARVGQAPHLSSQRCDHLWLGDEPALLHAATGMPVAVHPDRARAARALLRSFPDTDVLLADDGLQHRALARTIEIIVQDERGIGNGRLLPAGPLRETAQRLEQADWLITHWPPDTTLAPAPESPAAVLMQLQPDHAVHLSTQRSVSWEDWKRQFAHSHCSAVAGIGQPHRFFSMLRHHGLELHTALPWPDHRLLTPEILAALPGGPILMTAKDAIKLGPSHDPRLWSIHATPIFAPAHWMLDLEAQLRQRGTSPR